MPIRMTGITSGLDTDTIVKALVSSYSYKKDKYKKQQTKLSWTQDAWKSLNTKVYSLYSNISNLRFSSAYSMKKTTSSDTTKATVTAGNNAPNGTQKVNILQVAQSGYMTGGKISSSATTSTTLAELGYTGGDASINIDKGDGTSSTITVKSSSTIGEVIDQMKQQGLNASLDTTNHRLFISSKATGKDADFNLIGADSNGINALAKLGLSTSLTSGTENGQPVYTETGKTYQKYADLATETVTDAAGNTTKSKITNDDTIRSNIVAKTDAYDAASKKLESDKRQMENLTSAFSYAKAYAAEQDFYAGLKDSTLKDNARFNSVLNNYSSTSTDLVDDAGNIYKDTGRKDSDGSTIFMSGDSKYVSKGEDGKYYAVTQNEKTVAKDKDGNDVTISNKGKDGDKHYVVIDGNRYESDSEEGAYIYKAADGTEQTVNVSKEYSYSKTIDGNNNVLPALNTVATVTDAYDAYKTVDGKQQFTDEAAASFKANYATVKSFENEAEKDTTSDTYSKVKIKETVHGTASGEMENLISSYATQVSVFSSDIENQQKIIDDNSIVKNLVGLTDAGELKAAQDKLIKTAKLSFDQLSNTSATSTAIKVDGQNAVIKLNGVTYENSSNNITVNDLTINAQAVTGDGDANAISITTATDNQGLYDKVKDFLTQYNNIINEMSKLYNAESSKGYEPLTDDEKDAMSDKEVEKWEQKIKDSLLRRDTTLNGIMTAMTSAMSKGISINGKNYNLSTFGIKTLGYLNAAANENYAYHIDGDEDDANTSGNADKLMAMINSDPETVTSYFKELASNLYKELGDKMKGTTLSSSYTIYNDKQMTKQYKDYTALILKWENIVTEKEDYYYNKFTSMETALTKLNSTQSALGNYFA